MLAYHMGLTRKATQRAVHKQKGLQCASRMAMMHLDAVLSLLIICSKTVTAQTWFLPLKNVAIFCPKILAVLKHCGKVFGGVFSDSFQARI